MVRMVKLFKWVLIGLIGLVVLLVWGWVVATNRQLEAGEVNDFMEDAPGQFVEVNGRQLHVRLLEGEASGRPLLLLHGFGVAGGVNWDQIAPLLVAERPLIIPDFLGMGFSERIPGSSEAYTHQQRAAHLAALLDELDVAQVDIVGASYGGGVAAQFALDYPEQVNKLVLIGAQVYELGGGFFETLGTLPLGIGRAMTWTALVGGPVAEGMMLGGCEGDGFCPNGVESAARWQPTRIEGSTDALQGMSRTAVNGRIPQDLPQLTQETLLIWGTEDEIIAPEFGERLDNELPNSRLVWIDRAGHSPYLERPEQVADLILEFIEE